MRAIVVYDSDYAKCDAICEFIVVAKDEDNELNIYNMLDEIKKQYYNLDEDIRDETSLNIFMCEHVKEKGYELLPLMCEYDLA